MALKENCFKFSVAVIQYIKITWLSLHNYGDLYISTTNCDSLPWECWVLRFNGLSHFSIMKVPMLSFGQPSL